ncbi:MAG: hypothetical protein E7270_05495 [Lachnospiraceae bacterium]|nr:hypothetical protein [Lachnospiraceae bacterium]
MKNKLFNPKLYIQGLKQLSTIAIDAFAILLVICVFGIIIGTGIGGADILVPIYAQTAHLTFIPIMAFYILRFFHRRNSSDFYFSIPSSIACTSFSYMASVVTYALPMSALIIPTLSDDYDALERITYFIGLFATYLLVIATIYLAWSVTNTLFSHIVVSGLILVLPQAIITFISSSVYRICCFLDSNNKAIFLDGKLNLLTHNFGVTYENYDYIPGIIYTLTIAIIYFILAIILSKTKRSENAGSETNNRIVQTITRCILTTFVCLPAITRIVECIYYSEEINYAIPGILFLYFIAICVYFIYEFISTRTVKTFKSALLGLPVLILINILIISTILITSNKATNFTPDADEIDYVKFTSRIWSYEGDDSYYSTVINKVKITDSDTKQAISDALEESIDISKQNSSSNDSRFYYSEGYKNLKVLICSDGTNYYRTLKIKENKYYNLIANALLENDKFIRLASKLPDAEYISDFKMYTNKDYSETDILNIYEIYRIELASLSLEENREIVKTSYEIATEDSTLKYDDFDAKYQDTGLIKIYYDINDNTKTLFLNITEKTPKSYALYQEILRKE